MDKTGLRSFYETCMYGKWRSGEAVTYELLGEDKGPHGKAEGFAAFFEVTGGEVVKIKVSTGERKTEFTVHVYRPDEEAAAKYQKGAPFIVCMHPIMPRDFALKQGYGVIVMDSRQIASDDMNHKGAFYDLYSYTEDRENQTGVLMAWAWGASKVLDAVAAGLCKDYNLDPEAAMVTGVSRYGKATAVCGAFDERFRMVIPACSGAGGLALYSVVSEGNVYDFTKIGGPKDYTYTKNEPLDCLQSEAERGWFNDKFLEYRTTAEIPYDQENLVLLAMAPKHYYFIIAACMGEDWVNAPAMWECYKKAAPVYGAAGLSDNLVVHFHREGHAVLEEDLKLITAYFDRMYYGLNTDVNPDELHISVFDKQV